MAYNIINKKSLPQKWFFKFFLFRNYFIQKIKYILELLEQISAEHLYG